MKYPYTWNTKNGHRVVVTNPAQGHYNFSLITEKGNEELMEFDEPGANDYKEGETSGDMSELQKEIYTEWSQMLKAS